MTFDAEAAAVGGEPDVDAVSSEPMLRPTLERSPVWIQNSFGWLHSGSTARGGDVAVLLCPALNRDTLDAHHSFRRLADAFAASGYPALRFDYPGTGDSGDVTGEPWMIWQQSVHAAADWLRRTTGARQVIFCGLRIGGALAALVAASRPDAAGLILLAPVLRGRSYMRQLTIEAQLQNGGPAADGRLDFHELHLDAETVERIGEVDLRALQFPPGLPVAAFAQSPSTLLATCVQRWGQNGAIVATPSFDGLAPMLRHNLVEAVDAADFTHVLNWLRASVPARPATAPAAPACAGLDRPGCRETPLCFGMGNRLFGMLCEPDHRPASQVVLITNAGRDPHYGFARFGVEFARHLASLGIASLRFDFAGLGDSVDAPGAQDQLCHVFETDRTPDVKAALDILEARGYRRFALHGLCAGAYHGLQAAVADSRIAIALLINLPVFVWKQGDTIDFFNRKHLATNHFTSQLRSRVWWGRLLRGRVPVGMLLRAQAQSRWQRIRASRLGRLGRPTAALRIITALAARKTRILFLFSPGDNGVATFQQEFGPSCPRLRRFGGAAMKIVPSLDHQLSTPAMRREAITLMVEFLTS